MLTDYFVIKDAQVQFTEFLAGERQACECYTEDYEVSIENCGGQRKDLVDRTCYRSDFSSVENEEVR